MKKLIGYLMMLVLLIIPIHALDMGYRSKIGVENIYYVYENLPYVRSKSWANGNLNMYINSDNNHFQSQGSLYYQSKDINGNDLPRVSINWDWKGNNYGILYYYEDDNYLYFFPKARIIEGGNIQYEYIYVSYSKSFNKMFVARGNDLFLI